MYDLIEIFGYDLRVCWLGIWNILVVCYKENEGNVLMKIDFFIKWYRYVL